MILLSSPLTLTTYSSTSALEDAEFLREIDFLICVGVGVRTDHVQPVPVPAVISASVLISTLPATVVEASATVPDANEVQALPFQY